MKCQSKLKQIIIKKTAGEWRVIDTKIGKKGLAAYVNNHTIKLGKKYQQCEDCITEASGELITKRPYLSSEDYEVLEEIAKKMRISVSKVIDRLIISPLLLPD